MKFSLKNCKTGRQGRANPPQITQQKSPTALKRLDISIKCASKMARQFCYFCTIQQRKKPMTSFLSWAYGGKKGIRTLEGFRGPTRFPVVRLRPAQPSFHIFSCAAPDCKSYYSNRSTKCQAQFCIFLQKNLGWARCTQNVRVKRINLHVLSYCKLLHKVLKLYTNMKLCPKGEDISCIPFFAIWRLLF